MLLEARLTSTRIKSKHHMHVFSTVLNQLHCLFHIMAVGCLTDIPCCWLMAARIEGKILVIVLYRCGGHAFRVHDMKMSAEELVSKATPRDQDFPQERDILVIWRASDGLQVTRSGGNSELSEIVKRQPWARHLGRDS